MTAFPCAAEATATRTGTFNNGTGVQTTIAEPHELVAAEVAISLLPDYFEPRTGEMDASALDPTLVARVPGWKPDTHLTGGIKHTVEWLRTILDPRPAAFATA